MILKKSDVEKLAVLTSVLLAVEDSLIAAGMDGCEAILRAQRGRALGNPVGISELVLCKDMHFVVQQTDFSWGDSRWELIAHTTDCGEYDETLLRIPLTGN